ITGTHHRPRSQSEFLRDHQVRKGVASFAGLSQIGPGKQVADARSEARCFGYLVDRIGIELDAHVSAGGLGVEHALRPRSVVQRVLRGGQRQIAAVDSELYVLEGCEVKARAAVTRVAPAQPV